MKVYTRRGDGGETDLFGGERVAKDHLRVQAYGDVDELNACLGLLRAESLTESQDGALKEIQETLFELGADLATPGGEKSVSRVTEAIAQLESWIDRDDDTLEPLTSFVLPGGHKEAALYHVSRSVCRRAERSFWALESTETVPQCLGVYLNRLSDLLFVWARQANQRFGVADVPWQSRS